MDDNLNQLITEVEKRLSRKLATIVSDIESLARSTAQQLDEIKRRLDKKEPAEKA